MPFDNEDKELGTVSITARDDAYLWLLQEFGILDTAQLFKGTEDYAGNYTAHQQRLTRLSAVRDKKGRLLIKKVPIPSLRLVTMDLYALDAGGEERLAEKGKRHRFARADTSPFIHRYANGSDGFAVWHGCKTRPNLEYISAEEHFSDPRCPEERRKSVDNPISFNTKAGKTTPDGFYGIRYLAEKKAIFVTRERDRRTMTVKATIHRDDTIAQKVRAYEEFIRTRQYRTYWGVPNLLVHFDTVSRTHMETIKTYVRDNVHDLKIAQSFVFSFNERFGEDWRTTPMGYKTVSPPGKKPYLVPVEPFVEDILATPLETIDGTYDLTVPH